MIRPTPILTSAGSSAGSPSRAHLCSQEPGAFSSGGQRRQAAAGDANGCPAPQILAAMSRLRRARWTLRAIQPPGLTGRALASVYWTAKTPLFFPARVTVTVSPTRSRPVVSGTRRTPKYVLPPRFRWRTSVRSGSFP